MRRTAVGDQRQESVLETGRSARPDSWIPADGMMLSLGLVSSSCSTMVLARQSSNFDCAEDAKSLEAVRQVLVIDRERHSSLPSQLGNEAERPR